MMFPTKRRTALAAAVAILSMTSLSACAGSTPTGAPASSADPEVVAAAQAVVDEFSAEQPPIEIAPLPEPAEAGLTVAITTCPLPVCRTTTDAAAEAAEAIGWTVRPYENDMTPEGYLAMWDQVIQDQPDLITYTPLVPDEAIADQLAAAAAADIPVVVTAPAGDRPNQDGPVYAAYIGYPEFRESARLMGNVVLADGGTGEDTVFIWYGGLASIWDPIRESFVETIGESGSEPEVLDMPVSGIGTDVPGQVVSYLQRNPDVTHVAFALADYTAGVPEALEQAGLADRVKIISRSPQAANLANIQAGTEYASVGEENSAGGWRSIDGLARLSLGMTPDDTWFEPAGWHQIYLADTVTQTDEAPQTPGSPQAFLDAWGVN